MSTNQPDWLKLLRIARSLVSQVNATETIIDAWSLGGGTAMMLQINHRASRDIDIFLPDHQLLAFLNPQTNDFKFEIEPPEFITDGTKFAKFAFQRLGEIDFIVAQPLTDQPTIVREIDGKNVDLETVAEIIAKKIYYRGATLKARDIFDIAAGAKHERKAIVDALKPYRSYVQAALTTIQHLPSVFTSAAIHDLAIASAYRAQARSAVEDAIDVLKAV